MTDPQSPNQERGTSPELELLGETIAGKYRVLRLLGRGGFGVVYLVEMTAGLLGEQLAMKVLRKEYGTDEERRSHFLNEIRLAMKLVNKYIVQVRDVGVDDERGFLYYTMDYCPGRTLASVLKEEGRLDIPRSISIVRRLLRGVQTAHGQGVIHRDLKPANIMVDSRNEGGETVRILDFGIATAVESEGGDKKRFAGSPSYMPLEQFRGETPSFSTDLFAIGVILYECMTGERPFRGKTPKEIYADHKSRFVTPAEELNPDVLKYPHLNQVILRAIDRDPDRRFHSSSEFFRCLTASARGKPAASAKAASPSPAPSPGREEPSISPRARRVVAATMGILAVALGVVVVDAVRDAFRPATETPPSVVEPEGGHVEGRDPGGRNPAEFTGVDPIEGTAPDPPDTSDDDENALVGVRKTETAAAPEPEPEPEPVKAPPPEPSPEEQAAKRLELAAEFSAGGDWKRVITLVDEALDLHSAGVTGDGYRLKGLAQYRLARHGKAIATLERYCEFSPGAREDDEVAWALAESNYREKHVDESWRFVEGLLSRNPNHTRAVILKLEILDARGAPREEVLPVLQLAVRLQGGNAFVQRLKKKYIDSAPPSDEELIALRSEADRLLRGGQYAELIASAKKAFDRRPDRELGFSLASAYLELNRNTECRLILKRIDTAGVEDATVGARVHLLNGRSYLNSGQKSGGRQLAANLDRAEVALNAAIKALEPLRTRANAVRATVLTYRGMVSVLRKDLDTAERDFREATRLGDDSTELLEVQGMGYYHLGSVLRDKERRDTALGRAISRLNRYNSVLERSGAPRDAESYFVIAKSYLKLGDRTQLSRSTKAFAQAERAGLKTADLYERWGQAYVKLAEGKYKRYFMDAALKYRESYDLRPAADTCYQAAWCFSRSGGSKLACEVIDEGLKRFRRDKKLTALKNQICGD